MYSNSPISCAVHIHILLHINICSFKRHPKMHYIRYHKHTLRVIYRKWHVTLLRSPSMARAYIPHTHLLSVDFLSIYPFSCHSWYFSSWSLMLFGCEWYTDAMKHTRRTMGGLQFKEEANTVGWTYYYSYFWCMACVVDVVSGMHAFYRYTTPLVLL